MKTRLSQILLIDDSPSDNFIHARRIKNADIADEVVIRTNGREGLDYLKTLRADKRYHQPELIFLDINMPVMNGWEFLEEYDKLLDNQKAQIVLAMLTTSTAPKDRARAKDYSNLSTFLEKPLTERNLNDIIQKHFPKLAGDEVEEE